MAIFELSGIDYLHKHLIMTKFEIFEKSKKYYVRVLKFLSKMVLVETYLLRGRFSYEQTETGKILLKVVPIKLPFGFFLISRLWTLIRPNWLKNCIFFCKNFDSNGRHFDIRSKIEKIEWLHPRENL